MLINYPLRRLFEKVFTLRFLLRTIYTSEIGNIESMVRTIEKYHFHQLQTHREFKSKLRSLIVG